MKKKIEKAAPVGLTLDAAIDVVAATVEGQMVFSHLCRYCGFHATSMSVDKATGGIDLVTTGLNEARRGIYLHLRSRMSAGLRAEVEFMAEHVEPVKPREEERKNA